MNIYKCFNISYNFFSQEELSITGLSSSVDNLVGPKRLGRRIGILERGKSKPKVAKRPQGKHSETWAVDSSWEFIGKSLILMVHLQVLIISMNFI